jgi:hypothetical protein
MKKIIYLIFFLIVIISNIYSIEIKEYDTELVRLFKQSEHNKDSLGYSINPGFGACFPSCFTFSEKDLLYVCDTCNLRIAIYNLNLEYIDEINFKNIININDIKISGNNIILLIEKYAIFKMDLTGNIVYKTYGAYISPSIFYNNFFPVDNYVFFYDNKKKIRIINEEGIILDNALALDKLNNLQVQKKISNNDSYEKKIKEYAKENEVIVIDDILYHPDFNAHEKYNKFKKSLLSSREAANNYEFNLNKLNISIFSLIGFNKDRNSYWTG